MKCFIDRVLAKKAVKSAPLSPLPAALGRLLGSHYPSTDMYRTINTLFTLYLHQLFQEPMTFGEWSRRIQRRFNI